ncbi:HD domain-containing protein [Solimonas sp. K1W22B-7]|uniref:HD domain-containing protein n=1 Tax=Solimonas sp. K1W22B-7 TaxID=2303331 RepID=UPI000E337775|nr:HD domain-containing protein [Solimonas sp. K1W22B-7]AXQ27598.1 HD domain-containing protein [Solimonas sp. K1W22B-7]
MLDEKFEEALGFAARLHRTQRRKGVDTPYVAHLMSVSALVLEFGGNQTQAIAALLHDSVEDQATAFGGADRLREEIRVRFGDEVLAIVNVCTDADVDPKPEWWERKRNYVAHVREMDIAAALVSVCDKLHNARSILCDIQRAGADDVFARFTGGREGTLWYYEALAQAFAEALPGDASRELAATVAAMKTAAG